MKRVDFERAIMAIDAPHREPVPGHAGGECNIIIGSG